MNATDHKAPASFVNLRPTAKVYNWMARVSHIIYPPQCLLCGDPGHNGLDICAPCYQELPWNTHGCQRCALPLSMAPPTNAATDSVTSTASNLCGQCLTDPPSFEDSIAAFQYNQSIAWLISGLKFRDQLSHARLLGHLLAEQLCRKAAWRPDIVIPTPLHQQRLRERGYNQALEIARPIARQLHLPLDRRSVIRGKPTQAQTQLKRKARQQNLRGAFTVKAPLDGKTVAIIDDVVTSTATARELAKTLRKAGAGRIQIWSVARVSDPK